MIRFEIVLVGVCSAVWAVVILAQLRLLPLAGLLDLDLYSLYSFAAALGWVAGNVYMARRRRQTVAALGRRLLPAYLIGPPGFVHLVRLMASLSVQRSAPFVPVYGFAVYTLFFFVPVTLRPPPRVRS